MLSVVIVEDARFLRVPVESFNTQCASWTSFESSLSLVNFVKRCLGGNRGVTNFTSPEGSSYYLQVARQNGVLDIEM
jgi:hypothetical protein